MSFVSCGGDDVELISKYSVDESPYEISTIKMFTNQGEVFNDNLIISFQENQALISPENSPLYKDLTAIKYSDNTIQTTFYNRIYDRNIFELGQYEIWENIEPIITVFHPYDMTIFKYQKLRYTKILDEDYPNDDSRATERFNDCLFIERENTNLFIPMTNIIYVTHPSLSSRSIFQYNENNVFDPSFISSMAENDTIIVQSYRLKIIKE
ncbi:MAG: hypothetical protein COA67_12200 [Lutibacter sp.]|nr:MAG: hypothetical protein COA67_12200 [Lutibacter sp.]